MKSFNCFNDNIKDQNIKLTVLSAATCCQKHNRSVPTGYTSSKTKQPLTDS